jgi:CheY-like chemotaxis protein
MSDPWVLLVDDHEDGRELLREFLTMSGFTVESCASGEEALECLSEKGVPGAVITDLSLGAMSGIDLAKEMRTRAPTLPILAVTGHAGFGNEERLFKEVLVKPVALDALREALGRALA